MKQLHGLRKRWYMLRDLLGFSSNKYNYKNNYTKNNPASMNIDLPAITYKSQKQDSDVVKRMHEKFPYKDDYNIYGTLRKYLTGCDAAPGVTEQSLTILDNIVKPGNKILSIGCGLRNGLDFLNSLGCYAYGVDYDISSTNETEFLKWHNLNESNELPFAEQFFDIVFCQEVIEHIENPWLLFRKVKRVLKDNGYFVFTTPNVNCKTAREKYCQNIYGYTIHFNEAMNPFHINPIPFFEIQNLINYNGFSLEKISGNIDYYVNFEEKPNYTNILNRNDVCHFVLKKINNKIAVYAPEIPTYRG